MRLIRIVGIDPWAWSSAWHCTSGTGKRTPGKWNSTQIVWGVSCLTSDLSSLAINQATGIVGLVTRTSDDLFHPYILVR